jgi:hypothetical protein
MGFECLKKNARILSNICFQVRFVVHTTVIIKSAIFCDISHVVRWKSVDVSEEHIASILRAEE